MATDLHLLRLNLIVALSTDIVLLFTMLAGLLSKHLYERSAYGLGRLLWKQVRVLALYFDSGVLYLLICSPFVRVSFGSSLPLSPRFCPQ